MYMYIYIFHRARKENRRTLSNKKETHRDMIHCFAMDDNKEREREKRILITEKYVSKDKKEKCAVITCFKRRNYTFS